ncbi:unnamed protein product [Larinioides sclopetarius]|uniref:Uncharacterized protein n=1 Tax=Larinioides sclopetarius TaxID=280406 RepID=A0AAV1Z2N5_9ARAC
MSANEIFPTKEVPAFGLCSLITGCIFLYYGLKFATSYNAARQIYAGRRDFWIILCIYSINCIFWDFIESYQCQDVDDIPYALLISIICSLVQMPIIWECTVIYKNWLYTTCIYFLLCVLADYFTLHWSCITFIVLQVLTARNFDHNRHQCRD